MHHCNVLLKGSVRNVKCVDAQHASNGSCACQCRIVTVSVKWRWCWVVFVNTISREIVERWRGERCVCGVVMQASLYVPIKLVLCVGVRELLTGFMGPR